MPPRPGWLAAPAWLLALLTVALAGGCFTTHASRLTHTPGHLVDFYSTLPPAEAGELRLLADQRVALLCQTLGIQRPRAKVRILLFPDVGSSRRYLDEHLPERRSSHALCFVNREGYHIVITRYLKHEQTLDSLRHELVHFVLISSFYDLPPWVDEGLAQLLEGEGPDDWPPARHLQELPDLLRDANEADWLELIGKPLSQPLSPRQYRLALGLTWLLWRHPGHGVPALRRYLSLAHSGDDAVADLATVFGLTPAGLPAWVAAHLPPAD